MYQGRSQDLVWGGRSVDTPFGGEAPIFRLRPQITSQAQAPRATPLLSTEACFARLRSFQCPAENLVGSPDLDSFGLW